MTLIAMKDEQKLAYDFLNTITDENLRSMIQRNVAETMYSIEICYNYEYREFLRKNGKDIYLDATIFNTISDDEFMDYINSRLGIQYREFTRFEFVV